jgi:hypothetical protein
MKGAALALLLLAAVGAAEAQTIRPEPSAGGPLFGGVMLGALGLLGGAVIGEKMAGDCSGEFCDLGGAAVGALIGEALGLAGGVHLGNRSRGSFGLDLLTSTGLSAVTLFAANANDRTAGGVIIGGLITQIVATVAVERGTGRARARRAATVSVSPLPEGRIGLSVTIPLH